MIERRFVNAPPGGAIVHDSPKTKAMIGIVRCGVVVKVYDDDGDFSLIEYIRIDGRKVTGWVRSKHLGTVLVPDNPHTGKAVVSFLVGALLAHALTAIVAKRRSHG